MRPVCRCARKYLAFKKVSAGANAEMSIAVVLKFSIASSIDQDL